MVVQGFKTEVGNKLLSLSFPSDKKTILLKGSRSVQVLHTVESLLARDFANYYIKADRKYGYNYDELGVSQLLFKSGSIYGKNGIVKVEGDIPDIHCIRYLKGGVFRSFFITSKLKSTNIDYNLTEYSPNLMPISDWFRLFATVNNLLGSEVVTFDGKHIRFNFQEGSDWSIEAQKFVYMITAECFMTKGSFRRVLLMPDIDVLYPTQQIRLLELLDNIRGHELTLSAGRIEFKDVTSVAVTSLTV